MYLDLAILKNQYSYRNRDFELIDVSPYWRSIYLIS